MKSIFVYITKFRFSNYLIIFRRFYKSNKSKLSLNDIFYLHYLNMSSIPGIIGMSSLVTSSN